MRQSRFAEEQGAGNLMEHEAGASWLISPGSRTGFLPGHEAAGHNPRYTSGGRTQTGVAASGMAREPRRLADARSIPSR